MKVGPSALVRPHERSKHAQVSSAPRSFLQVLQEGRPDRAAQPGAHARPPAPSASVGRGLARVLDGAAAGEARLDAILEAAARGKTFTAGELLAMQATVFRYSQTIEVLSRATDRLVGAVKQTLGTPV